MNKYNSVNLIAPALLLLPAALIGYLSCEQNSAGC